MAFLIWLTNLPACQEGTALSILCFCSENGSQQPSQLENKTLTFLCVLKKAIRASTLTLRSSVSNLQCCELTVSPLLVSNFLTGLSYSSYTWCVRVLLWRQAQVAYRGWVLITRRPAMSGGCWDTANCFYCDRWRRLIIKWSVCQLLFIFMKYF